jgi:hypothetical protein
LTLILNYLIDKFKSASVVEDSSDEEPLVIQAKKRVREEDGM